MSNKHKVIFYLLFTNKKSLNSSKSVKTGGTGKCGPKSGIYFSTKPASLINFNTCLTIYIHDVMFYLLFTNKKSLNSSKSVKTGGTGKGGPNKGTDFYTKPVTRLLIMNLIF